MWIIKLLRPDSGESQRCPPNVLPYLQFWNGKTSPPEAWSPGSRPVGEAPQELLSQPPDLTHPQTHSTGGGTARHDRALPCLLAPRRMTRSAQAGPSHGSEIGSVLVLPLSSCLRSRHTQHPFCLLPRWQSTDQSQEVATGQRKSISQTSPCGQGSPSGYIPANQKQKLGSMASRKALYKVRT